MKRKLVSLANAIEALPRTVFAMGLLALALVRSGFNLFSFDWTVATESINRFPEATSYGSWSWGNVVLAKILGIDNQASWYALHIVLTLICLVLPLAFAGRMPRQSFYPFAIYWLLLPVVGSLLMWVGMYDVVTVIGATIVAFSRNWWQAAIGAVIWSSGNPEQAVVGSAILLALTFTESLRLQRRTASVAFIATLIGFGLSRILITGEIAQTRSDLLRPFSDGLRELIFNWPASVWGWNGIIWFVLLAMFLVSGRKDRFILVGALVVVPAVSVLITYDWDRVYWLVTVAALISLGRRYAHLLPATSAAFRGALLLAGLFAMLVVPTENGGFFFLISSVGELLR